MFRYYSLSIVFFVILYMLSKCEMDSFTNKYATDNGSNGSFSINLANGGKIDEEAIEFYDISSHYIYLKEGYQFDYADNNVFSVSINNKPVYRGYTQTVSSPVDVSGANIITTSQPTENIIHISYRPEEGTGFTLPGGIDDPRENRKIVDVLKEDGLYREGLSVRINTVKKTGSNGMCVEFTVTNNDNTDIYFPDPEKMGAKKFHFFTDALTLLDTKLNTYNSNISPAEGYNFCPSKWLTVLKSGERRSFKIDYPDFDELPAGSYYALFVFPGAGIPEDIKDIWHENGRIWLGNLETYKIVHLD